MVTYLFGSQSLIFLQQLYSQMAYDLYCIPREELNNDEQGIEEEEEEEVMNKNSL